MFISEKSFVYFGRLFYTVLTINLPTVYAGSSLKISKIQPKFILNICSFSSFAQFGFWINPTCSVFYKIAEKWGTSADFLR